MYAFILKSLPSNFLSRPGLPRGVLCYPCGCSPRAPARQAGSDVAAVRGGAICATTKRRDVVSREIPLPRTHVVIWSKQKRKKR